jgi:C4-dicarboxylate-specific signal transduction histidine kinase
MKKSGPQMSVLDVNELIRDVLTLTRNQILRNGVSPRAELAEEPIVVKGDAVQLQQVVLNLVLNGIEAKSARTEGPRELVLRSQGQKPDRIVISVSDSGVGIDLAHAEWIFDPFFTNKPAEWGWGWRSAAPSSRLTAVNYGLNPTPLRARRFCSRCPPFSPQEHDGGSCYRNSRSYMF